MNNTSQQIEERIQNYIHGRLCKDEIEQLWIDILSEPNYLDYLRANVALKKLYDQKRKRKRLRNTVLSPVLVIAAILIVVLTFNTYQAVSPVSATDAISLNELESPGVMRSIQPGLTGADSLLHEAFNAAAMGDEPGAFLLYHEIINNQDYESHRAAAYLSMGILFYNMQEFEEAAESFMQALSFSDNERMDEKTYWYLGNAYVNMDSLEAARESIQKAYELDGAYRAEASSMLRSLHTILGD